MVDVAIDPSNGVMDASDDIDDTLNSGVLDTFIMKTMVTLPDCRSTFAVDIPML